MTLRLLYDAALPHSLSHEAPAGLELQRWDGADVPDGHLVLSAAEGGCRGVILLGRDSLQQSDLREVAQEAGVALIAAATANPVKAKQRILKHLDALRRELPDHECLLVFATGVRPA